MKLDDYHRVARQVKDFVDRGRRAQAAVDAEIARQAIACPWCKDRPGETHFDAHGRALYDHQHHAGKYITPEESDRISRDGP